jgi:hypothetical protein
MILSLVAVAMAGIALLATRHQEPTERLVTPTVQKTPTVQQTPTVQETPSSEHSTFTKPEPRHRKPQKPAFDRSEVVVEVFNNSGISGLAGSTAARAQGAGWRVVGSDNWYGTIPATTVYFPPGQERQAGLLGKDLGIARIKPAIPPMGGDRLTVILTSDYV